MAELAPGIEMIDTRLGGREGVTAAYLVHGPAAALVETGAQTSVPQVRGALRSAGVEPDGLAWIVLTHVHLDHCGGTGALAAAFPRATVVVHRRGARHLAEPARLVAASAAVYGSRAPLYGGLDPTPAQRIVAADDGHRIPVGPARDLVLLETLGHARHHMSVLDEATGTVLAGDALGARMGGGRLYPTLPPPDVDLDALDASLGRLAALAPERICLAHYGPAPRPLEQIARARDQAARLAAAARAGAAAGDGGDQVAREIGRALPLEREVGHPEALELWRWLGWAEANVAGLTAWAAPPGG